MTVLLTSCTGLREVNDLGIVTTTAIDMDNGEILLTHEVIVPESNTSISTGRGNNVVYVQSKGKTVFDAIRNATLIFDRKLFLAHNRIFILGEEFAKQGIGDSFNFYVYDNEPRESAYIVVAKDAKGYDVMGINGGLSDSPGKYLFDIIENYQLNLKSRDFSLVEFLRYYLKDANPVTAVVEHIQQREINKEESQSIKDSLNVVGGAAFKGDRLIGYFDSDEMKGFNFIIDEFKNGLIVFETPDELMEESELIADSGIYTVVEVKDSSTKNRIEIIDEELHLKIDVDIKGVLIEDMKGLEVSNKDILHSVESSCSNQVKNHIRMAMEKAQKEFKTDSFSIGNLVHIRYPDLWREISGDWESVFSDLEYTVNVKTDLVRTGLLNVPINIKKELK
ncbi:MAG: Ger(x)C family spore germination protein [Tissierella sp.]|nr:Ger(x)C family spore germination protein [Tissierella sp.]